MVRRVILLLSALVLFAAPAFAKRSKVPALEASSVRAEPKADAAVVLEVKKGDKLMVLGKSGPWSQVLTDGGEKGWVLTKVVSAGGLSGLDASATTVAAAEGNTAIAMRGRPSPPLTVIVGLGGVKDEATSKLGELVKAERKLKVLEVREEATTKSGSPAGGLEGAAQLAGAHKADVVVAIQAAEGSALAYEIVDLKHKSVLATGTTTTAKPVEEVAAAVAKATETMAKNPAEASAVMTPAATPAATPEVAKPAATAAPAKLEKRTRKSNLLRK